MSAPESFPWRMAPTHLRTRRQLAAEGLRPNGQDVVATVSHSRGSRREPLTAHLFDIAKAAPKRTPSEAQLVALAKATRERQLRAAERRGIDRAEFDRIGDPGPAWTTPTSALADYQRGSALADAVERDNNREEHDR